MLSSHLNVILFRKIVLLVIVNDCKSNLNSLDEKCGNPAVVSQEKVKVPI